MTEPKKHGYPKYSVFRRGLNLLRFAFKKGLTRSIAPSVEMRLRWVCRELGFKRLILKSNKLRCYFVENPQSPFYESELFQTILAFVQQEGNRQGLSFKKSTRHFMLIKDHVKSLQQALKVLRKIKGKVKAGEKVAA